MNEHKAARFLGWFSLGLGLAETLAPRAFTRAFGTPPRPGLVRAAYGARELAAGAGILASVNPAPWVWARVAGDALDLATLVAALDRGKPAEERRNVGLALASVIGVTALDVVTALALTRRNRHTSGDGHDGAWALEGAVPSDAAREVASSITIGRPADELYRQWRDPQTLAQVMGHFADVRAGVDGRAHWRAPGALGRTLEWDTETVDDRPGESVGWRSTEGSSLPNEGAVLFRPAPLDWGTEVHLRVRFDPPGGALGGGAMKLLGVAPDKLAGQALRRFKSLVETGEVPTLATNVSARGKGDTV